MAVPPDSEAEQRAERIRELVVLCLERLEEDGGAAVEAIVRANPDVAAVLCARLGALLELGLIGGRGPRPT